jgi:hypothetical protein
MSASRALFRASGKPGGYAVVLDHDPCLRESSWLGHTAPSRIGTALTFLNDHGDLSHENPT